ncbi:YqjF family protein [Kocuria sp. M1R5S2]|uniref:YqjF family protein n=1 Tax=Kocuria rhizosphaerae TaxID=3376285 RepID=UPI0037AFC2F8
MHRTGGAGPWPGGHALPRPHLADQLWEDAVFLHWRLPPSVVAPYLPPRVEVDVVDGSAWVGLIGFRMRRTRLGTVVPLPHLGSFAEVNVRVYSRGPDGSRGVVFLSLDAPRLPVVLGARAAGVPYVWSRCRAAATGGPAPVRGYAVERRRGGARSSFSVRPDLARRAEDPLSLELTARFGAHHRAAGATWWVPVAHRPWPLYPARPVHLEDGLLRAAGLTVEGPPESVLFSPGVRARLGRPSVLRTA